MNKLSYCKKWGRNYKKAIGPLSEKEAEKLHNQKKAYENTFDPSTNWLPIPEFGEYEAFLNPQENLI